MARRAEEGLRDCCCARTSCWEGWQQVSPETTWGAASGCVPKERWLSSVGDLLWHVLVLVMQGQVCSRSCLLEGALQR